MNYSRYAGRAATEQGRSRQINRGYRGMADEMKRRAAGQPADCDDLSDLSPQQLVNLVVSLQQQLADAQNLINEMRAEANGDLPVQAADKSEYWTTKMVAEKSGKCIATITRNAESLGGWQLESGDWLFPVGTQYAGKRSRK